METFDIDNLIRNKLVEKNDAHQQEIESAKPFIWSAISQKAGKGRSMTWFHLAASLVLIVTGFTFILLQVHKNYQMEIENLSDQIEQLQRNNASERALVNKKNHQMDVLGAEMKDLKMTIIHLNRQKTVSPAEQIIYRTDTVYLERIRYVTIYPDTAEAQNIENYVNAGDRSNVNPESHEEDQKLDEMIFSGYSDQNKGQSTKSLKFKFVPFAISEN